MQNGELLQLFRPSIRKVERALVGRRGGRVAACRESAVGDCLLQRSNGPDGQVEDGQVGERGLPSVRKRILEDVQEGSKRGREPEAAEEEAEEEPWWPRFLWRLLGGAII